MLKDIFLTHTKDGIRTLSLLRQLGHTNRTKSRTETIIQKPDLNMVENALKLASEIDLSQIAILKTAVASVTRSVTVDLFSKSYFVQSKHSKCSHRRFQA